MLRNTGGITRKLVKGKLCVPLSLGELNRKLKPGKKGGIPENYVAICRCGLPVNGRAFSEGRTEECRDEKGELFIRGMCWSCYEKSLLPHGED